LATSPAVCRAFFPKAYFSEGIAEAHAVLTRGELLEMPDVEAQITLAARLGDWICGRRSNSPSYP
jgi:phage tail protein X